MDRTHRTPLALAILSVLHNQPRHPYDIRQLMRQRHLDRSIRASGGAVYHTIERLVRAGLVELVGQERVGHRPERRTYALTPAGRREFTLWLHELVVEVVPEYPSFGAALTFAPHLPPDVLRALLVERERRLTVLLEVDNDPSDADHSDADAADHPAAGPPHRTSRSVRPAGSAGPAGVRWDDVPHWPPRLFTLDREYARAMRQAERDWVRHIIAAIDQGDLAWPRAVRDWQRSWRAEVSTGEMSPDGGQQTE